MRRKNIDFRHEPYHKGGRMAVDHITPYLIAIAWKGNLLDNFESHPELVLPAKVKTLSEECPKLGDALVKKCIFHEDYNFVLEKIITYLL